MEADQVAPGVGEDVTHLMSAPPAIGADVTHLMATFHTSNARDASGQAEVDPSAGRTWVDDYPRTAAVARAAVNSLPGVGGIVGGVLGAPEAGLGAIPAAALGVGVGRGLRDLIAEGFGLESKSTPGEKATRIGLDVTEAAAAQAILPGLWEAIKAPGQTVGGLMELLPKRLQSLLPPAIAKAPARILERPAFQTWGRYVADTEPAATPTAARTGTSMMPSPLPTPTTSPSATAWSGASRPVAASAPVAPPAPARLSDLAFAQQEVAAGRLPASVAKAMERAQGPVAGPAAAAPVEPVPVPSGPRLVPRPVAPAVSASPVAPASAPAVDPLPAVPAPPASAISPQRTLNDLAIAARRAKVSLATNEYPDLIKAVADGASPAEAVGNLVKQRARPPAAVEPSSFANLPTGADVTARTQARNASGQWQASPAPSVASAPAASASGKFTLTAEEFQAAQALAKRGLTPAQVQASIEAQRALLGRMGAMR